LAALVIAQSTNECAIKTIFPWADNIYDNPVPYVDQDPSDICQHGATTCCKSEAFTDIKNTWTRVQNDWSQAQTEAQNNLQDAKNAINNWWNNLTPAQKEQLKQANPNIEDEINALKDIINKITNSYFKCLRSVGQYWLGVVCLGCDGNPSKYFKYSQSTASYYIEFRQSTCDDVWGGCKDLLQLANDIFNLFFNQNPISQPLCRDDAACKAIVCSNWIRGYGASVALNDNKRAIDSTSQTGSNTYTATGYAATEVGRQSSLNSGVSSHPIIALLVFVFALFLFF